MVVTQQDFEHYCSQDAGYCCVCDEVTTEGGEEPDAEGYPCDTCENETVMGMEQALLQGYITVVTASEEYDEEG